VGRVRRRAFRDQTYWARPVPAFGDPGARLLVVGLAPAAHGANRTGRMFTGDRSGQWLYRALHRAGFANQPDSVDAGDGLRLRGAYISAAARCAPPANKPTPEELERCRGFLADELRILHAAAAARDRGIVVLALGAIAFKACLAALADCGIATPRPRPEFGHGIAHRMTDDCTLVASYHPSQQNTQTGRLTEEMLDGVFATVRELLG